MDKQQLMDEFGLNDKSRATSNKGSSTGTKSNAVLGQGYLTDSDTKRLLGNKDLKNAFVQAGGDKNSWKTVNDVDTILDKLTKEPPKTEKVIETPTPEPTIDTSVQAAPAEGYDESPGIVKAKERVADFETKLATNYWGPKLFGGSQSTDDPIATNTSLPSDSTAPDITEESGKTSQKYLDKYKLDLGRAVGQAAGALTGV